MVHTCVSRLTYLSLAEDGEQNSCFPAFTRLLWGQSFARPEAVNISNVAALVDSEGKPHFKYIVEGANLFFTQQARLYLEKRKVVLFKDSSANKGLLLNCFWDMSYLIEITAYRWRDEFVTRSPRWPRIVHGRIRGAHDVQGWQAEPILPDLREGHPSENCGKRSGRVYVHLARTPATAGRESAHDHL